MSYKCLLTIIAACMLFPACAPRYKITYDIPPQLPDAQRKILMGMLASGKELYKENCSQCHGVFTKGKDKIPNFTNQQMDNYSSRYMMRDMKNHAVAAKMSPDQLKDVLTFLHYKRPQNPDSAAVAPRRF
jgi:cytochrome c553